MVISIFLNYQQQQILVYAQQLVKVSRRSDGGKSTKMSFKNVRYGSQKTVSNHLKLKISWGMLVRVSTIILKGFFLMIYIYVFSLILKVREEKRPLHGLLLISLLFIRHDILQGSQNKCYFGSATTQELNIKQGKKQMC